MTITRFHNTPLNEFIRIIALNEFIRIIEGKNSDSGILDECVVRLQQLQDLQQKNTYLIKCQHCEGTINIEIDDDGKLEVLE